MAEGQAYPDAVDVAGRIDSHIMQSTLLQMTQDDKGFDWELFLRAAISEAKDKPNFEDLVIEAAGIVARSVANTMIEASARDHRARALKETKETRDRLEERSRAILELMKDLRPLFESLQLGPFDRIVSVAIERAGGNIEVVSL